MMYRDFQGLELSMLGLGTMRLPVLEGDSSKIDEAAAFAMFDYAIEHGVNYFDTAWGYHGGNSEIVTGKALKRYDRDSFYIATKFPTYDTSNFGKHEEIFAKQLEKLQMDYVDFYLLQNVCEVNIEQYLQEEKYHTIEYFLEQKKAGKIRHFGFSVHGHWDTFIRFMERFGEHMEFCQIQLNYLDWEFQEARRKVEYCNEHGIPVIVMEPLRGGHLCELSDSQHDLLQSLRPGVTPSEWAFRWVQGVPGVAVVLSGMSNAEQLRENIKTFAEEKPLNGEELAAINQIAHEMATAKGLPCTACRYCTSYCPVGLDIPYLIGLYNEHLSRSEGGFIAPMALKALPDDKQPSSCIACNACHDVCPQGLAIPEFFDEFARAMGQKS